jgi:hypothetical protein
MPISSKLNGKDQQETFYVVYESYTDYTQFEGSWSIHVNEFESLEAAETWIEESYDWKESIQYNRTALGPLVKVSQPK